MKGTDRGTDCKAELVFGLTRLAGPPQEGNSSHAEARKNQKLFSKTWAQTLGHRWVKAMIMKTNQLQNSKIISASYGVKKLGPKKVEPSRWVVLG
jgi:hypothetical protein